MRFWNSCRTADRSQPVPRQHSPHHATGGSQVGSGITIRSNTEIRFRNSAAARPVGSDLVSQRADRNAEHSRGMRPVSPTPKQRLTNQFAFDGGNGMAHKPPDGFHFIRRKFQVSDKTPQRHDPSISRPGNFADAMSNSAVAMPHKSSIETKKKLSRISGKTRRLSGIPAPPLRRRPDANLNRYDHLPEFLCVLGWAPAA